jgi:hypothetical protein
MLIRDERGDWPALRPAEWQETCDTLQLYAQVVGKIRLALAPKWNQWWNVPFYVTARGLTTSAMPYGHRTVEARFDFLDHTLVFETSEGLRAMLPLAPRPVADFYHQVQAMLADLRIDVPIWPHPVELAHPVAFDADTIHRAYDRQAAHRFWTILRQLDGILGRFRGRFRGKCSPVHFFWGSFDLAVSRFSGRKAPERPGADRITADAYDEEVSSVGFWPGNAQTGDAMLYAYTSPEPSGYSQARVEPGAAFYSQELKEFLLPYEAVRTAPDPDRVVLAFAESTYLAGATRAGWDIEALRYDKADPSEYGLGEDFGAHR